MITIIDSGGANLQSVVNAFLRIGHSAVISTNLKDIDNASHVVLPGVGSARTVMNRLQSLSLIEPIKRLEQPVLGICLGMQLLYEQSEEDNTDCLNLMKGRVIKMKASSTTKVPHMGWNQITVTKQNALLEGVERQDMYFVHSYAADESEDTIAVSENGNQFSAACNKNNYYGVQFHPEKSGIAGERLLLNFLNIGKE